MIDIKIPMREPPTMRFQEVVYIPTLFVKEHCLVQEARDSRPGDRVCRRLPHVWQPAIVFHGQSWREWQASSETLQRLLAQSAKYGPDRLWHRPSLRPVR